MRGLSDVTSKLEEGAAADAATLRLKPAVAEKWLQAWEAGAGKA